MSRHLYLAPDPSMLSSLSFVELLKNDSNYFQGYELLRDSIANKFGQTIEELLEYTLQEDSHIRILITPTTFNDCKRSDPLYKFMLKYGYFGKVTFENHDDFRKRTLELARKYTSSYKNNDGLEKDAPMRLSYNAYLDEFVPSNDVMHMAETTVLGGNVFTTNTTTFVYDKKIRRDNYDKGIIQSTNDRSMGIIDINIQSGYGAIICGGRKEICPKPIGIALWQKMCEKQGGTKNVNSLENSMKT